MNKYLTSLLCCPVYQAHHKSVLRIAQAWHCNMDVAFDVCIASAADVQHVCNPDDNNKQRIV